MKALQSGEMGSGPQEFPYGPTGSKPEKGLEIGDIFAMLLRHKWIIGTLGLLGLAAAAVAYVKLGDNYQSKAKLLVKYVLERSTIDSELESTVGRTGTRAGENILYDEMQILTSWDLAREVAAAVGPEKLIGPRADSATQPVSATSAAGAVLGKITVTNERRSNVITVAFQHKDPAMVVPVLNELINQYFDKHLEIHRSFAVADLVSSQTEQVRQKLEEIDSELTRLRKQAGQGAWARESHPMAVPGSPETSPSTRSGPPSSWEETRAILLQAQTERVAQAARVQAMEATLARKPSKETDPSSTTEPSDSKPLYPSNEQVSRYQNLVTRVNHLRQRNNSLRSRFPPTNRLIVQNEAEITPLESERLALVTEFPIIAVMASGTYFEERGEEALGEVDIDAEHALLAAAEARTKLLEEKVRDIEKAEENLPTILSKIRDLERLKAAQEEKYYYFASAVDKARIDEMLDPSKMPNITVLQSASPPMKVLSPQLQKIIMMLAGGGLGLGIAIALAIELLLDRRIKSPNEFKRQLYMPLMLSIPVLRRLPRRERSQGSTKRITSNTSALKPLSAPKLDEQFWPYAAAIRDRLYSIFQQMETPKPRLVGFTGFTKGCGTSTLARTVAMMSAASGEKVLLIDLNAQANEPNSIQEAGTKLKAKGRGERNDSKSINGSDSSLSGPVTPKKLCELLPYIQTSEYGYVIFDMPPVDPTSPTKAMAAFMDTILLVVDATKDNRDIVKQGYEELQESNDRISCIYNKALSAGPSHRIDVVTERRRRLIEELSHHPEASN